MGNSRRNNRKTKSIISSGLIMGRFFGRKILSILASGLDTAFTRMFTLEKCCAVAMMKEVQRIF